MVKIKDCIGVCFHVASHIKNQRITYCKKNRTFM